MPGSDPILFQRLPPSLSLGPLHLTLRHPLLAWVGLRAALAQHTRAEHNALQRWAMGRRKLVEIGVAEGCSALALRESMSPDGVLYLIDPFHLSRLPLLNSQKRTARKTVNGSRNGHVVWVEKFSLEAVDSWTDQIELLFLDGDHSASAVRRDWEAWHPLVASGGVVLFHDACLFQDGWTKPEDGPVKLVDTLFRQRKSRAWKIVDEVDSLVVVQRES